MKTRSGLLALLIFAPQADASPVYWSPASGGNGHYYDLVLPATPAGSYTWDQANAAATAMGGYLATVTSAAENNFLDATFGNQITPDYALLGGPKGDQVWIGLNDLAGTFNWQWVTGEPFTYSNWAPTEPNYPYLEFYGLYWRRDFGNGPLFSWNNAADVPYDLNLTRYGFFVEWNSSPAAVPEPARLVLMGFGVVALVGYGRLRKS
jgi:hypothetical protein